MRRLVLLFAVCVLGGATACATASLHVIQSVNPPAHQVTLSVAPAATVPLTDEQTSSLRTQLISTLAQEGVSVVPRPEPNSSVVEGTIDGYDRGNRALRYFISFGAGKGTFASTWLVKDTAGQQTGQCKIDGSISFGGFGGSYEDVLTWVGERLAQCLLGQPASQ
jgi:hypothetical protein